MKKITALLLLTGAAYYVHAQTGPGGVGNSNGANGQPQNVLWLKSGTGVTTTGALIDSWADQSGNLNNATGSGATRPTLVASDANFNNQPSLSFSNTPGATNYHLRVTDADVLDNTSNLSVFNVFRPTNAPGVLGILSKRSGNGTDQSYVFYHDTGSLISRIGSNNTTAGAISSNTVYVSSTVVNGTLVSPFLNGTAQATGTGPATIANNTSNLFIGTFDDSGGEVRNFEGTLTESIIYRSTLNAAQRQIVENYLSSKFNITITGDVYAGDTPGNNNFDFDVAGIGKASGQSHTQSSSTGFMLSTFNSTLDVDGEFVLAGHNNVTNAVSVSNLGPTVQQRWARTWYVNKTTAGTLDAAITFDLSEAINGQYPRVKDNYVLLKLNTGSGNYEIVTIASASKSIVGDRISFQVPDASLTDGVYTLGTINSTASPVNGTTNQTWYSYQTGNWSDWRSWTLDGGVIPLLVNPGNNSIPDGSDNVIITTGKTITIDGNNVAASDVEVIGTLDVATSTGHIFSTIDGSGKIRIAGNGSLDNFPAGTTTGFADPTTGGTLEIYGAGLTLNQARLFNNVEIAMTTPANTATLLANYTIQGKLLVNQGVLQINNNASTIGLTINVTGDVEVESSGKILTGTGNARHELNFYSNFNNAGGTVEFTNRVVADVSTEATDGIVDANFISNSKNQQAICNGSTRFYRIEVNKGTDDTYKLTISASAGANFNLFGAANYVHDVVQLTINNNALGLIYGTVEIQSNVAIPILSNTGNYTIFGGAQLWVNGGTVRKDAGNSLVPYGKLTLTSGILSAVVGSGITTRDNGSLIVEGGTLTTNQIRTSVLGPTNIGGYIQTGGTVTVDGGGAGSTNGDYYVFSMTYPGNVFRMSGGTLIVKGSRPGTSNTRGGIFINSDPANYSVTGGEVIAEISNNNSYKITSRVPLWNLTIRRTAGTGTVVNISGGESGDDGTAAEITLPDQPLVVLNDLNIQSPTNLTANNNNVTIGGSLTINNGAVYTPGNNVTIFNGLGVSSINIGNATTQVLNSLTISKQNPSGEVNIVTGAATALQTNGELRIETGIFKYNGFIVAAKGNVYSSSTAGTASGLGKILMNGAVPQTLTSSGGIFYNLEIDNTNGVSLANGALTILNAFTLTNGIFNINTFKLTLSGAAATLGGSGFSVTKMIQTSANDSDGGLELYLDTNEILTFPLGVAAKFTPVTATFTAVTDDGLVRIVPVNGVLQTTDLTAGLNILAYYWKSVPTNFTTAPTVTYKFTYVDGDVGGVETTYVPGKVLNIAPFSRSFENDIAKVVEATNEITFNGTGSGFPLEQANYTAGESTRFAGTPQIYYTRLAQDGGGNVQPNWNSPSTWTRSDLGGFNPALPHSSTNPASPDVPTAGDIAQVGWNPLTEANPGQVHVVYAIDHDVTCAVLNFLPQVGAGNNKNYTNNPWIKRNLVMFRNSSGSAKNYNITEIKGEGQVKLSRPITVGNDLNFGTSDFGDFNSYDKSIISVQNITNNTNNTFDYTNIITWPNNPSTFPNLVIMSGAYANAGNTWAVDITVNNDLIFEGGGDLYMNTGAAGDVLVKDDLIMTVQGGCPNPAPTNGWATDDSKIVFRATGNVRKITVMGDIDISEPNSAIAVEDAVSTLEHGLYLQGNYTQNTSFACAPGFTPIEGLDLYRAADRPKVNLYLTGTNTASLTISSQSGGESPQLNRVIMNKGINTSSTFTFNNPFTLNAVTNITTKPLTLTSGLLILNHSSININLTTLGDFSIPAAAGLQVTAGQVNVSGSDSGIALDGLLRVSGGIVNMDDAVNNGNNYIEYSSSGNAALEISSGSLTVGSQIRRELTNTAGILRYSQTGGAVVLGRRAAPTTNRGVLEILNTGSQFIHTGGSLTLVRGINSATVPTLILEPASATITGTTITIGNANTPAGVNSQNIGIKSLVALNNLTIDNTSANSPKAKIFTSPLAINGVLTVNTGTTLDAQGLNLLLGNNMILNGTYTPGLNTTYFTSSSAAAISGSGTIGFYNFTKNGSGILSLGNPITVNKDFYLISGTLADAGNAVTIKGDATVNAIHTSTGGNGLTFAGTSQQLLMRTGIGTGTLGIVTVDNSRGILIPDGLGYDFVITTKLRLKQGVFDIGGSLLTLSSGTSIEEVNPFSATNMIQTNSSFTDNGVKKNFNAGVTTDFTFPVGQGKYTPVKFIFSSVGYTTGSGTPSIIVRPANEIHPSIVNDTESPGPQIVDVDNVLQYHWIINADNVANTFRSDMVVNYIQSDVKTTGTITVADYIAARILSDNNASALINKFSTTEVDETLNAITFSFSGVTDANISGEYFAGVDPAIPNSIPIYTTVRSGNVNDSDAGGVFNTTIVGGGAPSGGIIIVSPGHTLTFNTDNVRLYSTEIQSNGILNVDGTIGHRLGTVTGLGTLRVTSNTTSAVLPAGFYNTFFDCAGGGLSYAGTGNYEILGGITSLRKLTLEGSGQRNLASNDLQICEDMTLTGPTFQNTNNRAITIQRDMILSGGSFNSGTGTITVNRDVTVNGGTFNGQTGGNKLINRNLSIASGAFNVGSGGTIALLGNFTFSGGSFNGGTNTSKFAFQGSSAQNATGAFTGASGFHRLEINNSNGLTLAGNADVSTELLLTSGNITTGTNNFTLASAATISPTIGKQTSFVNGKLRKIMGTGTSFTFPIGKNNLWRNASLNSVSVNGSTWTAEYFNTGANTEPGVSNYTPSNSSIVKVAQGEYWKVSDGNVGATGASSFVGLSWGLASNVSANSGEREALEVMAWNSGTSNWNNFGGATFSSGHTQSFGSFVASSPMTFSERIVTLGTSELANPLPVVFLSFTGRTVDGSNQLRWETASELNSSYFAIERSADGEYFEEIGRIDAAGVSKRKLSYQLTDSSPLSGWNYYRLKQVDFDGEFDFYKGLVALFIDGENLKLDFTMYPNPTNIGATKLNITKGNALPVNVKLFDISLRLIDTKVVESESMFIETELQFGDSVQPGIYFVEISQGSFRKIKRLVVKK